MKLFLTVAILSVSMAASAGTVIEGMKLVQIERRSVFAKIGMKNGDVLESVNGQEVMSVDVLGERFSKLKRGQKIEVVVRRQGKPMVLQYTKK